MAVPLNFFLRLPLLIFGTTPIFSISITAADAKIMCTNMQLKGLSMRFLLGFAVSGTVYTISPKYEGSSIRSATTVYIYNTYCPGSSDPT